MKKICVYCMVVWSIIPWMVIPLSHAEERVSLIQAEYFNPAHGYPDISESITYPNQTLEFSDIRVTFNELCADEEIWYTAVTCELMIDNAEIEMWNQPSFDMVEDVDFYPSKPVYYVAVDAYVQEYAHSPYSNERLNYFQVSEKKWQHVTEGIYHEPLQIAGNQIVPFYIRIRVCRVYDGQMTQQEGKLAYNYQILPTLDYCSFQGEIMHEEYNYRLLEVTAQLTPIADYIYVDNDSIDPQKDRTASIVLLRPDGSDMNDHATELPDSFYAGIFSKDTEQIEYLHLFTREGDRYVYQKMLTRPDRESGA